MIKIYISNIAMGWPIERQKDLLASQVADWPQVPTYVDLLPPAKRKTHIASSLIQRAELLRETGRPENVETIIVASLACLAWEQSDFLKCIAAISQRGATLVALNTGRRIVPDASPTEMAEANEEFLAGRRSKSLVGLLGYKVSAERRSTAALEGAKRIKDRWVLPTKDYPTDALLEEAGICRNTANLYLHKRKEAQRQHRNAVAQAERNRKQRVRIEQMQEQAA